MNGRFSTSHSSKGVVNGMACDTKACIRGFGVVCRNIAGSWAVGDCMVVVISSGGNSWGCKISQPNMFELEVSLISRANHGLID